MLNQFIIYQSHKNYFNRRNIIGAIFLGILGMWNSQFLEFKNTNAANYQKLITEVTAMATHDEDLYMDCLNSSRSTKDVSKTRAKLVALFIQIRSSIQLLSHQLSPNTYKQIHNLGVFNDRLLSSKKGICDSRLLLSTTRMDEWKDNLLLQITKDASFHNKLVVAIKYYTDAILQQVSWDTIQ